MRILVDARHLMDERPTGVGEYTTQLLRALFEIDRENQYELFTSGLNSVSPPDKGELRGGMWTHVGLPNKLLKAATCFTRRPRLDRLATAKPDLVWLPNLNVTSLSPSIPYVLTIHDLSWKIFPEFFSWKMRLWHAMARPEKLVANAAAIIVPSQATKEDVVRTFQKPDDQVHVVAHGVDPLFRPEIQPQDSGVRGKYKLPKRYVLFVGTLEPRKNIVALIDAMEAYRRETRDDVHLVLAGGWGWKSQGIRKGLEASGREAARHFFPHGLKPIASRPWVHVLNYVPRHDLPALYRAAAVLVWPSIYEGFGLPVLEAMACGTPVITSHTSSLPELTGDAAILVNPYRTDEITLALRELMSSSELRERLRRMGLERVRQYSWKKAARETLEIFKNSYLP